MTAYYNEFDPFAAAWLRELIQKGLIAKGDVDERSITEIKPSDLKGYTQCHFFAGIGGWSQALRLANWSDDKPVWTGSPPCQPFSVAGQQQGTSDERHLWPVFFDLIRECKPPTVFGEQVASAIRQGWFDNLQKDLEAEDYASAMAVLPACSVGSPHKRERLWFIANRTLANSNAHGREQGLQPVQGQLPERFGRDSVNNQFVGNADNAGLQMHGQSGELHIRKPDRSSEDGQCTDPSMVDTNFWESSPVYCRDGKYRPAPTEPALFPLVNGVSNRVGILRGAGNAIVPQVAAEIIKVFTEYEMERIA
tara:strand:+ start:946 stop:1869 length:924 start_codon:yes stop_codon:yes gene_type:complete